MAVAAGLPKALCEKLWSDPDALLANGTMLKDGDRTTVVRLQCDGRCFVFKRYNLKGPLHTAVHMVMPSRAQRCMDASRILSSVGLHTPRTLALIEERFGPLRLRAYLLTEFIEGESLLELINRGLLTTTAIERIADQFAHIHRTLQQARIIHGDMKASNFIIDREQRIWLVDLDGMRRCSIPIVAARDRWKDLDRFTRNWQEHPEVAAIFRDRLGTS